MPRVLLENIHGYIIIKAPDVWRTRQEPVGKEGAKRKVKVLAFLFMMGMGASLQKMDDKLKISEETLMKYLVGFVKHVK